MNTPTIRARPEPSLGDATEAELVEAARVRDEAAVRELIRRMNPRLFRVARGIATSDAEAEEIVQDTYLAAFTRLDSFRGEAASPPGSRASASTRRGCAAAERARTRSMTP